MKREKLIEITDKIYFYCLKIKEEYQATDEEMSEAIAEVLDFSSLLFLYLIEKHLNILMPRSIPSKGFG